MTYDLLLVNSTVTLEERQGSFASVASQDSPLGPVIRRLRGKRGVRRIESKGVVNCQRHRATK